MCEARLVGMREMSTTAPAQSAVNQHCRQFSEATILPPVLLGIPLVVQMTATRKVALDVMTR